MTDCYVTCTSTLSVTTGSAAATKLQQVLTAAADFFSKALSTVPASAIQPASTTVCGQLDMAAHVKPSYPSHFTSPGVTGADFVLYVTTRPTAGSTIAFATSCQFDSNPPAGVNKLKPVVGHMNWGPSQTLDLAVAVHEITHALGFSESLFQYYASTVTSKTTAALGRPVTYFTGANVKVYVQQHFNCQNIPGAELEGDGGSGTAGSHWEKRIFDNEYMTGVKSTNPIFTGLTMAALQDSGWYRVTPTSLVVPLQFGAKKGCTFALSRCAGPEIDAWPRQSPAYACDATNAANKGNGCTVDYKSKTYCDMRTWTPDQLRAQGYSNGRIPTWFQYFASDPYLGGSSVVRDFCPTPTEYANQGGLCAGPAPSTNTGIQAIKGETYGSVSRCLASTMMSSASALSSSTLTAADFPVGCYTTACFNKTSSPTELEVRIRLKGDGAWYTCKGFGMPIRGTGYETGEVLCPDPAVFCADPANYVSAAAASALPTLASSKPVTPASGAPGSTVTLTGSGFSSGMSVTMIIAPTTTTGPSKEYSCSSVNVISSTSATCTAGAEYQASAAFLVADSTGLSRDAVNVDGSIVGKPSNTTGGPAGGLGFSFTGKCGPLKCYIWFIIGGAVLIILVLCCICAGNSAGNKAGKPMSALPASQYGAGAFTGAHAIHYETQLANQHKAAAGRGAKVAAGESAPFLVQDLRPGAQGRGRGRGGRGGGAGGGAGGGRGVPAAAADPAHQAQAIRQAQQQAAIRLAAMQAAQAGPQHQQRNNNARRGSDVSSQASGMKPSRSLESIASAVSQASKNSSYGSDVGSEFSDMASDFSDASNHSDFS